MRALVEKASCEQGAVVGESDCFHAAYVLSTTATSNVCFVTVHYPFVFLVADRCMSSVIGVPLKKVVMSWASGCLIGLWNNVPFSALNVYGFVAMLIRYVGLKIGEVIHYYIFIVGGVE